MNVLPVIKLVKILRKHLHFIVIVPLVIIVMTWPALLHVVDSSIFWLPTTRDDIYMLFWDAWYNNLILAEHADFYFTALKFYPHGVTLAYHNFSLPHMLLVGGLSTVLPPSSAFNLTYLLLVFASVLSGYVYLQYLLRDRWLSFFGAIVFGTSAFVLSRPATPHISFIATLPLSMYFLHRAFNEERWKFIIVSGVLIGFTAFIGLYTLVCLLITVSLYILLFARTKWRHLSFWGKVLVLVLIVAAIGAIRVYPMLVDAESPSSALAKNQDRELGKDLLGYFVNYEHPVTGPLLMSLFGSENIERGWRQTVYLGYIPILLIALGLAKARFRRRILPWLLLSLIFLLLRLGTTLSINDVEFETIRLPKFYLAQAIPQVFQPFWTTDQFFAGAVFPFALLTCYGMKTLLQFLPSKRHVSVIIIAAGLVAFEYYQAPDPLVIPDEQLAFLRQLSQKEDQDSIRLINLPMGGNLSKIYDFYQTYNGYPQVEGRPTRTPPSAFNYINGNLLLNSWRRYKSILCLPAGRTQYLSALDQLRSDGFTHIVFHHWLGGIGSISHSFTGVPPAYEDGNVRIYRLAQMPDSCSNQSILVPEPFSHFRDLALSSAIIADPGTSILSFHPSERIDDESFRYLSSLFLYWKSLEHVYFREGQLQVQSYNPDHTDLTNILAANQLIVLLYDPSQTEAAGLGSLIEEIEIDFNACQGIIETADAFAMYYVRADFPCELLTSAQPFEVFYDNQIRLMNLLQDFDGEHLNLAFWWTNLPRDAHAVSIQVFDPSGAKVAGSDFVIHHVTLAHHRLNLSSLERGDYLVKLILYNFETGISVPGTVTRAQTRFERELEIGRITIE